MVDRVGGRDNTENPPCKLFISQQGKTIKSIQGFFGKCIVIMTMEMVLIMIDNNDSDNG